ncbi:hypothetical protein NP233_g2095 [Leucocoprinus birnbaumii]|uniref:Uncharacterized protein n=1 Tax=Leucocoprinus birnbaumii TaxID=56174 RepID=A0AAD5W2X7_9AGAR|nr:hypothetical protein NP233_g2095 [Leucocoprinus birnbaumii]
MLPATASSRPLGLPTNPRPQKAHNAPRNSPYNPPPDLPSTSTSSARTRTGPSSSHARSRSQPPRAISSPRHSRTASARPRAYEESDMRSSASRDRPPLLPTSNPRSGPGVSRPRQPSPAPSSPEDLHEAETPYVRLNARRATIDESSGDGYAIWNAVSNVASALTISVSKAWSANVATFPGEETPPGQESRLTRAMKAYHIAQARSPADLPDWLFDERERRMANVSPEPDDAQHDEARLSAVKNSIRQNRTGDERLSSASQSSESTSAQSQLRGTDRLKAMREARRRDGGRDSPQFSETDKRQAESSSYVPQSATRQPRMGLPSGPQRGRR